MPYSHLNIATLLSCIYVKVSCNTDHYRRIESMKLRNDMESPCYHDIEEEHRIYIDLPQLSVHVGHVMGEVITERQHTQHNYHFIN